MTRPRFSIVTVCRNDLAGLHLTAESVQGQSIDDYEWIVVDGASTDGTVAWLRTQDGVRWVSEPDAGIYDAMNKGLDLAEGRYVVFMNAGDQLATAQTLSRLSEVIEGSVPAPDFIYGDSVDSTGSEEFYRPARSHRSIWLGMFTQHQAMVFSLDRVGHQRHNLDFALSGDYAFVSEFLAERHGRPVVVRVDWPICRFALGGVSTTSRRAAIKEDFRIRRRVLGMSWLSASALVPLHLAHYLMKVSAPRLFRRLRYQSRTVPSAGWTESGEDETS